MRKSTWFRAGGNALGYVIVNSISDLKTIISYSDQIKYYIVGVGSNLMVRDGGFNGLIIKLGKNFNKIKINKDTLSVGGGVLDVNLAKFALKNLIKDFEFFSGIPGTIGGAIKMNAGCYGSETKDVLVSTVALDRSGRRMVLNLNELKYSYRHSGASNDLIYTEALFKGVPGDISSIHDKISEISDNRNISQPIKEKTGGSTFKNPDKKKSKGLSAWELIDAAGGRGLKVGGAQMSQKHCNFMINTGEATAADFECLGNEIVSKVKKYSGVELQWEIQKIGNF